MSSWKNLFLHAKDTKTPSKPITGFQGTKIQNDHLMHGCSLTGMGDSMDHISNECAAHMESISTHKHGGKHLPHQAPSHCASKKKSCCFNLMLYPVAEGSSLVLEFDRLELVASSWNTRLVQRAGHHGLTNNLQEHSKEV